jgi:hypothetical protein
MLGGIPAFFWVYRLLGLDFLADPGATVHYWRFSEVLRELTTAMEMSQQRLRVTRRPVCLGGTLLIALLGWSSIACPGAGPEFRVNTYSQGRQSQPAIAGDSQGSFVVWASDGPDASGFGVFGQRYDMAGSPVGEEFQVNSYTTANQMTPSVAVAPGGRSVVVWNSLRQDGHGWAVLGQRYDAGGARVGGEFQANTYTTGPQGPADVAMSGDGRFVVVWRGGSQPDPQDGDSFGVFGQRYDSAGKRLGAEFQVNTYTTAEQTEITVGADAGGGFVVVWTSPQDRGAGSYGNNGIFAQRYDSAGKRLGAEFQVNTYTTNQQRFPSVASDDGGGFMIVWTSSGQDGFNLGVFGQRYDRAGKRLGAEFQVNTHTTHLQGYPDVATDGAGRFVVTWASLYQDGAGFGVFGQRYDSTGTRVGGEFQVNTYTRGNQHEPAVAVSRDGFVVVWQSNGQDRSGAGVFGRRYDWPAKPPAAK